MIVHNLHTITAMAKSTLSLPILLLFLLLLLLNSGDFVVLGYTFVGFSLMLVQQTRIGRKLKWKFMSCWLQYFDKNITVLLKFSEYFRCFILICWWYPSNVFAKPPSSWSFSKGLSWTLSTSFSAQYSYSFIFSGLTCRRVSEACKCTGTNKSSNPCSTPLNLQNPNELVVWLLEFVWSCVLFRRQTPGALPSLPRAMQNSLQTSSSPATKC